MAARRRRSAWAVAWAIGLLAVMLALLGPSWTYPATAVEPTQDFVFIDGQFGGVRITAGKTTHTVTPGQNPYTHANGTVSPPGPSCDYGHFTGTILGENDGGADCGSGKILPANRASSPLLDISAAVTLEIAAKIANAVGQFANAKHFVDRAVAQLEAAKKALDAMVAQNRATEADVAPIKAKIDAAISDDGKAKTANDQGASGQSQFAAFIDSARTNKAGAVNMLGPSELIERHTFFIQHWNAEFFQGPKDGCHKPNEGETCYTIIAKKGNKPATVTKTWQLAPPPEDPNCTKARVLGATKYVWHHFTDDGCVHTSAVGHDGYVSVVVKDKFTTCIAWDFGTLTQLDMNTVNCAFATGDFRLVVLKGRWTSGDGTGTVTDGDNFTCDSACFFNVKSYDKGSTVVLSGTADSGSAFKGWQGAGCSGTDLCTLTMDSDKVVVATFAR